MTMNTLRGLLIAVVLSAAGTNCASRDVAIEQASKMAATTTTFVIVRHAEKATDDPKDPTLTEIGRARAQRVNERLANSRIAAIYATRYRRTQLTAAKTAQAHGLEVIAYDAAQPAADFAAQLRRSHTAGVVLVVGHSNTVAGIAGALCACEVTPVRDDEYDRWIEIQVGQNGTVKYEERRY